MKRVVCVGSVTVDVLVKSADFKVMKSHQVKGGVALAEIYGGKTEAEEMLLASGGSASNVAVGLTRLGLVTAVLARVGDDPLKEMVLNELKLEGVETSLIQVDQKERTALSVVLIAPDGGRSIVTYRGAAKKIEENKIDWEKLGLADWLQIGPMGGNLSLVEDLVALAKLKKIRVGWNPGKSELTDKERVFRTLSKVDLLVVNRMEAAQLLRHSYDEVKAMGEKIMSGGVGAVAITDGRGGAGLASEERWRWAKAFKTVVIDETGAGDAFVAGMVAGRLLDKDWETSLVMGLANGASQVGAMGAKAGLLHKEEMRKWLRRRVKISEERLYS